MIYTKLFMSHLSTATRFSGFLGFAFAGLLAVQGIASAHDAGREPCKHNECSGGTFASATGIPDTQPRFANSVLPGRVADCPAGFTNNGLTCGRGAASTSAPSRVANCPEGFTNLGLSCFQGASTFGKGCTTIFKKFPCPAGFTDNGCFCGRGPSSLGASSMTCPTGFFLNANLGRCYQNCPADFTNTGETCFRGVATLGMSSMSCHDDEELNSGRCFPKSSACPPDRELFLSLCYTKCPEGTVRTAISTCVHGGEWSGNTHLWVVNRALDLLANANDPVATRAVNLMRAEPCKSQWENGLWDSDAGDLADAPSKRTGSHFYNGSGKDAFGNATQVVTYLILGEEQNRFGNARTNAKIFVDSIQSFGDPKTVGGVAACYALGRALHYMTDVTQPMHATGFSGVSLPLLLHPLIEEYWPRIQTRFPVTAAWDRRSSTLAPDDVFHEASVKSASLAPDMMKVLMPKDGTVCTIDVDGFVYTGYCFIDDPVVDAKLGEILQDGYQSTASWVYSVFRNTTN